MVRTYQPRNPIDPGSKLQVDKSFAIIHQLLAGRRSAWIAEHEKVSKNTVTAISTKFRRKLRSSTALRQACLEPFYKGGYLSREAYIHFLDGPAGYPPGYFEDVARCVFRCPSQFLLDPADFSRFVHASKRRVLNLQQMQTYVTAIQEGRGMHLREACPGCAAMGGPVSEPGFYLGYRDYLIARKLRANSVEEHYFLYAVFYLLHHNAIDAIGILWSADEVQVPERANREGVEREYHVAMFHLVRQLVGLIDNVLRNDPLE